MKGKLSQTWRGSKTNNGNRSNY